MQKTYDLYEQSRMLDNPAMAARALENLNDTGLGRMLVGAWRWKILQAHAELLLPILSQGYVLDVGGAAGPVGYNATVIDHADRDRKALYDIRGRPDAIFSSHTLEHIADLDLFLLAASHKLRPGGQFVAVVPGYRNEVLRASNWPYHEHTFHLLEDEERGDVPSESVAFDAWVGRHFEVDVAVHHTDRNILVVAHTPVP